ncbi:Ca-activated chloride channel family protein [Kribbella sp. VKM Ac-2527]|uniref:Ca-activated chloride channel family protein n=1 Tax=Kribbella caucasensis TaxID=2512215 RepID=A0A4R6KKS2_9ACTN|nr:VIT domain-containing protein [Kribbella sp. VKM Ac-2527]TDO50751.1 Ca-activated chloride channel family protein [Kribbella sp. VKM Ac-2527]
MTAITTMHSDELRDRTDEGGLGTLRTERGNLPLERIDAHATITGLVARTVLTEDFCNPYDVALEATYVFPLPDRAAVTGLRMEADGRTIEAELRERAEARATYDAALAAGQRASIAEEERPDVFTLRVGNLMPGERVTVRLTMVGPLPYEDGEATYRLPLVVAPRYIPGKLLLGWGVGDGVEPDTDAVPDASRITPPILLPGFPNPIRLGIRADVDPGGLTLHGIRSSLHAISSSAEGRVTSVAIEPGERVDRDFVLRLAYGEKEATASALTVEPDDSDASQGTFELTVLPPVDAAAPRPRDVVLVLDRSGSMSGWKMVAARRAAARIVDTLTDADRFAVLTFDSVVEHPNDLPAALVDGTDRNRFRAVEHLAGVTARGGTEMLAPLREATTMLAAKPAADSGAESAAEADHERDRVLVLVTDGQVGNEDQILSELTGALAGVRVHTVGIDRAVNAGFLGRLAAVGGGRCELVESEDRLDEALDRIHRRIGTPLLTNLTLSADGLTLVDGTTSPARMPDAFVGVPLVIRGRYSSSAPGAAARLQGTTAAGEPWQLTVPAVTAASGLLAPVWARGHLRDLEDRYAAGTGNPHELESQIVAVSLRNKVLCRFTALVAVDSRVVADGGPAHRVIQPVELPSGWDVDQFSGLALAPMAQSAAHWMVQESESSAPMPPAGMRLSARPGGSAGAFGPARRGRQSGRAKRHVGLGRDLMAEARVQLADEARLLRAAGTPTRTQRLAILADLATRLDALVHHLAPAVDDTVLAPLRELVTALAACEGPTPPPDPDLDVLWQRAIDVIDAFTGTPPTGAPTRQTFWKRPG